MLVCQPATGSARSQEFLGEVWGGGIQRDHPALRAKPLGFPGRPKGPPVAVASMRITLFIEEPPSWWTEGPTVQT